RDVVVTYGDSFTTGSRLAQVMFDWIIMRDDGDPDGSGEFLFNFMAGNPSNPGDGTFTFSSWPGGDGDLIDISDHDPPAPVPDNTTLRIAHAPRRLLVQVVALEDDTEVQDIFTHRGLEPIVFPFFVEGTDGFSGDIFDTAWTGVVFDIENVPTPL